VKVLLVGMMGTGKTTVGAALAACTGWPYLDNDVLLERTSGSSAQDLLASQGEAALRTAESQVLTLVLGMPGDLIAGVAAGVVLSAADRARLRDSPAHVVWLRAKVATLVRRVDRDTGRPWLGADSAAALRAFAAEREPLFAEIADQVVDVDTTPSRQLARLITAAL